MTLLHPYSSGLVQWQRLCFLYNPIVLTPKKRHPYGPILNPDTRYQYQANQDTHGSHFDRYASQLNSPLTILRFPADFSQLLGGSSNSSTTTRSPTYGQRGGGKKQ
ncbi:hypothetical protein NPIL_294381 [Nephila pilipes]|uniref:Uncharacterized protein n=1 Tax=Nephila pilipes TaxID=299642 RepID=A0A8X6UJA7_NEPPI|nr:hypothetical protein NPIL_294381 [Nephila pilipes]